MLEGLYLSYSSEHPSQSEANVSIALTAAVMAFLLSGRKTRAAHKNISLICREGGRVYSEKGSDYNMPRGFRKTNEDKINGLRSCYTLPLQLQLLKLQHGPGLRAYNSAGMWRVGNRQCWEMICSSAAIWNTCLKFAFRQRRSLAAAGSVGQEAEVRNSRFLAEHSHARRCHILLAHPDNCRILHSAVGQRSIFGSC